MDAQTIFDNAIVAQRAEEMKTSEQLTLGELIMSLEKCQQGADISFDFEHARPTDLTSYRGNYRELAICFDFDTEFLKVSKFVDMLKEAIGKTYQGWKGGDFLMGKTTPMWAANSGSCGQTAIIEVVDDELEVMLVTKRLGY